MILIIYIVLYTFTCLQSYMYIYCIVLLQYIYVEYILFQVQSQGILLCIYIALYYCSIFMLNISYFKFRVRGYWYVYILHCITAVYLCWIYPISSSESGDIAEECIISLELKFLTFKGNGQLNITLFDLLHNVWEAKM